MENVAARAPDARRGLQAFNEADITVVFACLSIELLVLLGAFLIQAGQTDSLVSIAWTRVSAA